MAKVKKRKRLLLNNILSIISIIFALISLLMIFFDFITVDIGLDKESHSGISVALGKSAEGVAIINSSIGICFAYICVFSGLLLLIINIISKKQNKYLDYLIICLFIISAILLCFGLKMVNFASGYKVFVDGFGAKYSLAYGAIISIICLIISSVLKLINRFLKSR